MNSRALYGDSRSQYSIPLTSNGPDSVGRETATTSIVSPFSICVRGNSRNLPLENHNNYRVELQSGSVEPVRACGGHDVLPERHLPAGQVVALQGPRLRLAQGQLQGRQVDVLAIPENVRSV